MSLVAKTPHSALPFLRMSLGDAIYGLSSHVTTCLPVYCCVGIQPCNSTLVFSEFPCSGLCRAHLVENACLHPPLTQVLLFVSLGYTVQLVFTCGRCMVIIGVTLRRLLRRPRHVPLTNTCSICHIRPPNIVVRRCWSIFRFSSFQNGKKQWLRPQTVGAKKAVFLLLRTPKSRVAAPPHTP